MRNDSKSKRGFLNAKSGMAAFEWEVDKYGASLSLSDCGRQILLSFEFDGKGNVKALRKVRRLQSVLAELEAAILER